MNKEAWQLRLEQAIDAAKADGRIKSKRQLSRNAGLSENWVSQMINEGKMPRTDNFRRLCAALGVSTTYIMKGADLTKETEDLIEKLRLLDPGQQESVERVVDELLRSRQQK